LRAKLEFFEIYSSNFKKHKNEKKPNFEKLVFTKRNTNVGKHYFKTSLKRNFSSKTTERTTAVCSHLGFRAELKLGFVFGCLVFNRYFWLTNPKRTASGKTLCGSCRNYADKINQK
jgi:hypothetical protein